MFTDRVINPLDFRQSATSAMVGEQIARKLKKTGCKLPDSATYLALGAGEADGELALAKTIGINESNITLLDKLPSVAIPPVRRLTEGIFSFLGKPPTDETEGIKKFDLVTALGIDYVIKDENKLRLFIDLLAPHLNSGAHIVIFPYYGPLVTFGNFQQVPLFDKNTGGLCYQFTENPEI